VSNVTCSRSKRFISVMPSNVLYVQIAQEFFIHLDTLKQPLPIGSPNSTISKPNFDNQGTKLTNWLDHCF
jgi:hypothetical protein